MKKSLSVSLAGACAGAVFCLSGFAQAAPEVTLMRFADCGTPGAPIDPNVRFSDTFAYPAGTKIQLTFSCYLIKHGDDYMVWDTGQSMAAGAVAPKVSLVDQLAKLGIKPDQIKYVGISHYHADHIGQVAELPKATLLIGKADWDGLTATPPNIGANPALVAPWISGGGKVEGVPLDKDVFGDGTVVMLATPGHTRGHHSLLVKLAGRGPILLTGDLAHFRENYDSNGVPSFNADRSESLASIDRFKKIAANLKATVIIQHDVRDVSKLPEFPAAAQ